MAVVPTNNLESNVLSATASFPARADDKVGQYDAALTEDLSKSVTAGNITLTADEYLGNFFIEITDATVGGRTVTLPAKKKWIVIRNAAANTQSISIVRGATSFTLGVGKFGLYYTNGTTDGLVRPLTDDVAGAGGGLLAANNLSDVASAATSFGNIKQAATDTATGVVELATPAETVTGTDSVRASTPEGVKAAINALINAAPGALDTLDELAAALGDDASFASTITTALALKAPLASPTFTGTVAGVTKAMVGLGNVDNTADTAKPVSTAQQTALDLKAPLTGVGLPFEHQVACSDETTALTAGTAKITFRMPCGVTLTAVRASLTVAQTSGSIFTVDINQAGSTVLSTKLTIDNGETTSVTAATPSVISTATLVDDALMTIDIDQIGDGTAKGLKVTLIGVRA